MSDLVVDSSVVAKWILPEADSNKAQDLLTKSGAKGDRLIVLDLAFPEAASAIWKRHREPRCSVSRAKAGVMHPQVRPLSRRKTCRAARRNFQAL